VVTEEMHAGNRFPCGLGLRAGLSLPRILESPVFNDDIGDAGQPFRVLEPLNRSSRRESALTLLWIRWSELTSAATRFMGRELFAFGAGVKIRSNQIAQPKFGLDFSQFGLNCRHETILLDFGCGRIASGRLRQ
jgi:hypothetical protein